MLDAIRKSAESWGIKVLFGLIIVVFVFWGVGTQQGDQVTVLAYVNDEPIPIQEFGKAYDRFLENLRRTRPNLKPEDLNEPELKRQVFSQIINDKLLRAEAKRLNITASPFEVRKEISLIPAFQGENKRFDPEIYRRILANQSISTGEFEQDMEFSVVMRKLQEYTGLPARISEAEARVMYDFAGEQLKIAYLKLKASEFADTITPTPEEIRAFYDERKETFKVPARLQIEYLLFTPAALAAKAKVADEAIAGFYEANSNEFTQEEQVRGRHILVRLPQNPTDADVQKGREKIDALKARIQAGEDFAAVAKEASDDTGSKEQGGELGWFGRGQMVEEFETLAFALEPGKLGDPIQTPFGWHILLIEERKPEGVKPLAEVKEEIRKRLAEDIAADTLADTVDSATEQVITGTDLPKVAETFTMELHRSEEFSKDQAGKLFGIEAQVLDDLFAMRSGQVTDSPLPLTDGYMLAKVIAVKPEEYQTLEQVQTRIVESIKHEKAMQRAQQKADELLAAAKDGKLPDEFKARMNTSDPFGRQGFIPNLGYNLELPKDAFATQMDTWLPKNYVTDDACIIARVQERIPPAAEQWDRDKGRWMQYILQGKRNELFQAMIESLRETATLEMVNDKILQ